MSIYSNPPMGSARRRAKRYDPHASCDLRMDGKRRCAECQMVVDRARQEHELRVGHVTNSYTRGPGYRQSVACPVQQRPRFWQ